MFSNKHNMVSGLFLVLAVVSIILFVYGFMAESELAAVAGIIPITVATAFWTTFYNIDQNNEKVSQFYLEKYIEGIEAAHTVLSENNDRVLWISAARMLAACRKLEDRVTADHHRHILEMKKEEYRYLFGKLLQNPEITPSFFYGFDKNLPIVEAAKKSTENQMSVGSGYEYNPPPYVSEIPEEAVRMVWSFSVYPDDYNDLLTEKFSQQERVDISRRFPAISFWLKFRESFNSYFGALRKVGNDKDYYW